MVEDVNCHSFFVFFFCFFSPGYEKDTGKNLDFLVQNLDTDPDLSNCHVCWVRTPGKPATINPVNCSKLFKMAGSTTSQFMYNQNP